MESDRALLGLYRANAEALGRTFGPDDEGVPPPTLSTDMANVSLAVPTIHPLLGIDAGGWGNHQPGFAAACVTASADRAVHDGALAAGGPRAVARGPWPVARGPWPVASGGPHPVASGGRAWQTACRRGRGVPGTRRRAAEERDA